MSKTEKTGSEVFKSMKVDERIILMMFEDELQKRMNDEEYKTETRKEALRYAQGYYGDEITEDMNVVSMMELYLMGLTVGIRLNDAMKQGADPSPEEKA